MRFGNDFPDIFFFVDMFGLVRIRLYLFLFFILGFLLEELVSKLVGLF